MKGFGDGRDGDREGEAVGGGGGVMKRGSGHWCKERRDGDAPRRQAFRPPLNVFLVAFFPPAIYCQSLKNPRDPPTTLSPPPSLSELALRALRYFRLGVHDSERKLLSQRGQRWRVKRQGRKNEICPPHLTCPLGERESVS